MRRIFRSLFSPKISQLQLCKNHQGQPVKNQVPVRPYSTDHCLSCNEHVCHVCSEEHVAQHCQVELGIVKDLGTGILRAFNLGDLIKVNLKGLKCICGKPLGRGSAICAACGMASCSEACHQRWEQLGYCTFQKNFYSMPDGTSMRSILFDNIETLKKAKINQWTVANRSSTAMICCYASSEYEEVFLQRGYRNYGHPNDQLLDRMEIMPRTIDYQIHFDRRCQCECAGCKARPIHSANNCQSNCEKFDLQYMKRALLEPESHRQCTCTCEFCSSGIVVVTHRLIDCMPFCKRSKYHQDADIFV